MPLDIHFITVGKTKSAWLQEGMAVYEKRLKHYCRYRRTDLAAVARGSEAEVREREGKRLLATAGDAYIALFDVDGRSLDSPGLAQWLDKQERANRRSLALLVGGAWGFSDAVYAAAGDRLSLSPLTLNHQIVRLVCTEQLYRAFTIRNGEAYHHG